MLDIFDILGPVMVGPSSSHTAGAVRIGRMARTLLGAEVARADIGLHGSFADTGRGHGTDRALVAGLLGMKPDDLGIPQSFEIAANQGLEFHFHTARLRDAHPNTAVSFTGIFNTLVVRHQDVAGELSRILNELSVSGVNIANMSLNRDRRGGAALTVVETDQKIPADALERIQALYGVLGATYYEKEED